MQGCSDPRSGLVAQVTRAPLGHVALRYRILARPQNDPGGGSPFFYGDLVTMELAGALNGAPVDTGVAGASANVVALPSAIDGMTYGSDWSTLDAAAPGSGAIGVAVALGGARSGGCGGGPPLPPVDVEILVETISAK
jgi:hypothetical protein